MDIHFRCKHFSELSISELYAMMRLRQEIFIIDQNCNYLDADGLDTEAYHLNGFLNGKLVAHCRLIKPNVKYAEASIGRVVNALEVRGNGVGKELMNASIKEVYSRMGKVDIRISAQTYLQKFYEDFEFEIVSEEYMEDTLPHFEMLKVFKE